MEGLPDQSSPPEELIPNRALAVINLAVGRVFLLIVFAVSAISLLMLAPEGGGDGDGWGVGVCS